jgi:hypothetical protein
MLLVLIVTTVIPGVSSASSKELNEIVAYLNQFDALSKYSSKAVDAYNANLIYNTKNRKAMYDLYKKTIIPNYTIYVNGIKKIKLKNKELARIHKILIQYADTTLKGYIEIQGSISKPPGNTKAFNKGIATIEKGQDHLSRFNEELEKYVEKEKLKYLSALPVIKTLPLDFNKDDISERLRPQVWRFYQAYVSAFPSGDTSRSDKLLKAWIASKNEGLNLRGPEQSIQNLNELTLSTINSIDKDELADWAKAVSETTINHVSVTYAEVGGGRAQFTFHLKVDSYTDDSTPLFQIVFYNTGEQYEISSISQI